MRRIGNGFLALLCLLALLLLVGIGSAAAQETPSSTPLSQPITSSEQPTMLSWDDLERLSGELSSKANDLIPQVVDLNSQLGKLQSSLLASTTLLSQSLDMRKSEAQAAGKAVKAALNRSNWWMRAAFVFTGAGVGYVIDGWKGAAYGASVGVVADAGVEIAVSFHLRL